MASGSNDQTIKIWDLNVAAPSVASSLVTTLTKHGWKVLVVTFETTGLMASGDEGRRVVYELSDQSRNVDFQVV